MELRNSRWSRRAAVLAAVVASASFLWIRGAAASAGAAGARPEEQASFSPSLAVDRSWTDNVRFLDTAVPQGSDWTTRMTAVLPVRRAWKTGSLDFRYVPSYERHSDLTALNHDEHRASLALESAASRATTYGVAVDFSRTQSQGVPRAGEPVSFTFLSARTNRSALSGRFDVRRRTASRWRWNGSAQWLRERYEPIGGFDAGASLAAIENRTGVVGVVGLGRQISRAVTAGVEYGYERFDLDRSGPRTTQRLDGTFERAVGDRGNVGLAVGAYRRTWQEGDPAMQGRSLSETGGFARLTANRAFRLSSLAIEAEYAPTSQGALRGSSKMTAAGIFWRADTGTKWTWTTGLRVARREASEFGDPTLRSAAGNVSVEWRPIGGLGVSVAASRVRQTGGAAAGSFSGSYSAASAGVLWYPRGPFRARTRR